MQTGLLEIEALAEGELSSEELELAECAVLASRVTIAHLRALRRTLFPSLRVEAEGNIWFSQLISNMGRGPDEIIFRREVAYNLRRRLAAREEFRRASARQIIVGFRQAGSVKRTYLTRLEEDVSWWAVLNWVKSHDEARIELEGCLKSIAKAILNQQRRGIAAWALGLFDRVPELLEVQNGVLVRELAALTVKPGRLSIGKSGKKDQVPADVFEFVRSAVGRAPIAIRSTGRSIVFSDSDKSGGDLDVQDTDPRVVAVEFGTARSWLEAHWRKTGSYESTDLQLPATLRTLGGDEYVIDHQAAGFAKAIARVGRSLILVENSEGNSSHGLAVALEQDLVVGRVGPNSIHISEFSNDDRTWGDPLEISNQVVRPDIGKVRELGAVQTSGTPNVVAPLAKRIASRAKFLIPRIASASRQLDWIVAERDQSSTLRRFRILSGEGEGLDLRALSGSPVFVASSGELAGFLTAERLHATLLPAATAIESVRREFALDPSSGPTKSATRSDFFISRAGADSEIASRIAGILESAGHRVVLQQWDFANRNFMERMDAGMTSGARVIAILSPQYLASDYCAAEWMHALSGDPFNRKGRLVVLRVAECQPTGLLRSIAYWDLAAVRDQEDLLADIVKSATLPDAERRSTVPARYWRDARPLLHKAIRPTPTFTGRDAELTEIDSALWSGRREAVAITQRVAVTGLGGIGKSTLAREYAWRAQDGYAGIWWLDAAREGSSSSWEGIEQGLVELGEHFLPGLARAADRAQAARQTLEFLAQGHGSKPWLLVFENLDDRRALDIWSPPPNVHILVTTRISRLGAGFTPIELEAWPEAYATAYLAAEIARDDINKSDLVGIVSALGALPLALAHAAAYLRDIKAATPTSYLAAISRHMTAAPDGVAYDRAVFATLMQQIEEAEARSRGAREVLSLAAFSAPDDIPEELFSQAIDVYPAPLSAVLADPLIREGAISALDRLSLIDYSPTSRTFSVHRLVQAAVRATLMDSKVWAAAGIGAVNAAYPGSDFKHWPAVERLLPHARMAADLNSDDVGQPLAILLARVGEYLSNRAAYESAEPLIKRSIAISEQVLGPDHPEVGVYLSNLAGLYEAQGKLALAEPLCKRTLSIFETALGPDHASVGMSLNRLAGLYSAQGKYDLCEPLLKRSLAISEKALGPAHPDVAASLNNLAGLYRAQGKYDLAEPIYKSSLEIREKALGPDHPLVGASFNNLAALYNAQGKYDLAEPLYKHSLIVGEKALGSDHPDVAASLNNLASLYRAQGKYDLAEPVYKRSLEIREKALGLDHPDVGTSLSNLAHLYAEQGRYDSAELLYRRSIAIQEKALGQDHPFVGTTINNLAMLYNAQKKYDLAEPLYKRALAIGEKALGPDHPDVAASLNNLAELYREQGKYELSESLLKRSLVIGEESLGPDHPDFGASLNNLGYLYEVQKKYDMAEPIYKRTLLVFERALGPDHPRTAVTLSRLAALYRSLGRLHEALPLARRAQAVLIAAIGKEHPRTQSAMQILQAIETDMARLS